MIVPKKRTALLVNRLMIALKEALEEEEERQRNEKNAKTPRVFGVGSLYSEDVRTGKKVSFSVSQYSESIFESCRLGIVSTRQYIDGFTAHDFNLKKAVAVITLPDNMVRAYDGKCPINMKKINNLRQLSRYIPEANLNFFNHIMEWPTTNEDSDD
ncbi:hypothetical protein ABEB36_009200 [Hypothenemus hampei]|uniref:Uncharacterized protein n=1 Tax=Hypothenemus hampei TaxID=57062 RepID=A0ABD1EPH8_HYPHA